MANNEDGGNQLDRQDSATQGNADGAAAGGTQKQPRKRPNKQRAQKTLQAGGAAKMGDGGNAEGLPAQVQVAGMQPGQANQQVMIAGQQMGAGGQAQDGGGLDLQQQ